MLTQAASLERTFDTVLTQAGESILADLAKSHDASQDELAASRAQLESEYDRIVSEAGKEADKLTRQITGSADLETRNAQLRLVEEATDRVVAEAALRITAMARDASYSKILESLLEEAIAALGTTNVLVSTSASDADAAASVVGKIDGAELAPERIKCMGGIRASTRDGAMSFDNTLDARMDRLKPLIRKEIAARFGLGN